MQQSDCQILHDRYRIQSLLGRQTGRRTFLARDLQTDSPVVIKLLFFGPDFSWDDLKLFEREAETLKVLEHSSIPRYLDSFEVNTDSGKGYALVQSYIEARSRREPHSGTLQDWVEGGRRFSEDEIRAIAQQLLEILIYLHDRKPPVIHRDIKPSNILLGDRTAHSPGTVYLVDFGSVQTAIHSGTMTVVGTYGYMPPEQFGGRATARSDLYSLGATIIYLATGQHPAALLTEDLELEFQQLAQLSPQLTYWLRRMVQSAPPQRFASAKQALQALNNPDFDEGQISSMAFQLLETERGDIRSIPRPNAAKCVVTQDDESISVLAPSEFEINGISYRILRFFCGFIAIWILAAMILPEPLVFPSTVGITTIWILAAFSKFLVEKKRVESCEKLLKIDRKEILLWKTHKNLSRGRECLRQANSNEIKELRLVTFRKQYYGSHTEYKKLEDWNATSSKIKYYVEVITNDASIQQKFAIGEQMCSLSRSEAEWLANELSLWLEMPVTEIQMYKQKSAQLLDLERRDRKQDAA